LKNSVKTSSTRLSSTQPKITTHYSVIPRESDQRWKGIYSNICIFFIDEGKSCVWIYIFCIADIQAYRFNDI